MNPVIARITWRQLLGRRRTLLVVLLGVILVAVAAIYALANPGDAQPTRDRFTAQLLANLGLATLMPLVALIMGTAAIGGEIEDGTLVYLLAKPIPRRTILLTKLVVAAVASVLVTALPVFVAALIGAGGLGDGLALGFTVASAAGSVLYCCIFVALSLVTARALVFGLFYVLIWEGFLAGLFAGTQTFSVRQQALAVAEALWGPDPGVFSAPLELGTALVVGGAIAVLATVLAVRRLARFQLAGEPA